MINTSLDLVPIRPAAFSAFMRKNFIPLILSKIVISYLDSVLYSHKQNKININNFFKRQPESSPR